MTSAGTNTAPVITIGQFYTARALSPGAFDLDTPTSMDIPSPTSVATVNPRLVNQNEPRTIIFTDYDASTTVGTAYVVSSLVHEHNRLHRWVPIAPAIPKDGQPQLQLLPSPISFFENRPVYLNYAFKLRVRVHQPIPSSRMPHGQYDKKLYDPAPFPVKYTQNPGEFPPETMAVIESLHTWFWIYRKLGHPPPSDPSVRPQSGDAGDGNGGNGCGGGDAGREGQVEVQGQSSGGKGLKQTTSAQPLPDTTILKLLYDMRSYSDGIWSTKNRESGGFEAPCSGSDDEDDDDEDNEEEVKFWEGADLKELELLDGIVNKEPVEVELVC
ncbi:hypothetical protein HDV05_005843 [Chytridiales sp. JEL 0842]|nr:hypothetical protein HDV05_005843 [Chytridiales sp. JEL 0842]